MRNLKRVLSLVLALVMAMSLMVVGTSAAFKDEADFSAEYVTAAEVLTNLNVLWGYEDGSFQPKGDITRAEVAALIYRAVTGDVTDAQKDVYSAMTNDFSDVKDGQWFAGYVNFCANAKYVAGYGDGTFGPNDKVTGYQTLAMILRAIGYDHNGEFIGADWEIRTAAIAQDIGLLDNVQSEKLGQPASRELVAELIFQAMNAPMVKWVSIYEGYRPLDKAETTLGQKVFELNEVEGVVVANEAVDLNNAGTSLDAGETQIGGDIYNLSTDISIIGEKVSVWVADEDAVSTPVSLADVDDYSNTTDEDTLEDLEDGMASNVKIYNNYKSESEADTGLGVMVKAIDNTDDGKYDIVLTETDTLAVVQYVKTDGEVILDTVKSEDDQVVYSGVAVDDVVLTITYGGRTYIERADYVTGHISEYEKFSDAENTATINGSAYMVSDINYAVDKNKNDVVIFDDVTDTFQRNYNGQSYNYYQDAYGNIIAYAKADELAVNYALILDFDTYKSGPWSGELWVKYLTVNNEVKTAVVDEKISTDFSVRHDDGDVVEYRLNDDGEFVIVYNEKNGFMGSTIDKVARSTEIEVNAEEATANISGDKDVSGVYNVNSDLVVFYYVETWQADGQRMFHTGMGNNNAYYGVLTGDAAIADLDGAQKFVSQIDAEAAAGDHTGTVGDLKMVNINGFINPESQYCYILDNQHFKATTDEVNGTLYYYNAINADGDEIVVILKADEKAKVDSGMKVWLYEEYTENYVKDGTVEYNRVKAPAQVAYGDLHAYGANTGKFQVYDQGSQTPLTLKNPATFVDVEAKAAGATLSVTYCSTGYVVYEGSGPAAEAVAVFVTEKADGDLDYIDVNSVKIRGEEKSNLHLYVGSTIDVKEDYYQIKIGTGDFQKLGKTDSITVTKDWAGQDVQISAYVTDGNTALDKLTKATLDGEQLPLSKGYDKLDDAIANAININLPNKAAPYAFVVNTGANANGVNLWGSVATASDLAATKTVTFAPQATLDGETNSLAGINVGSYIIVRLQNDSTVDGESDVAFYAYHIVGIK